jgi:hypothetical protein
MSDTPAATQDKADTGDFKSALVIGGVALAIVVIVFVVIGVAGSGDDANGPTPVYDANTPHDESQPHSHGPTPASATVERPDTHSHGDGQPHSH